MTSAACKIAIGVVLYLLVALSVYASRFLWGGGPFPLWFSVAKVLSEAVTSVAPGFVVGWLSGERGLVRGATAGAIGALVSTAIILYHWSLPPPGGVAEPLSKEVFSNWALTVALATLAASFTNAIGGIAGATVRRRTRPYEVAP